MENVVSYYGKPIKHIMLRGGNDVAYCLWDSGIRLISLNGYSVRNLNNSDFSLLFNIVADREGLQAQ
jgi:hypothetical protein